jgi:hypothetical protein
LKVTAIFPKSISYRIWLPRFKITFLIEFGWKLKEIRKLEKSGSSVRLSVIFEKSFFQKIFKRQFQDFAKKHLPTGQKLMEIRQPSCILPPF